ncbi:hypothetical protein BH20ACI2_BH20ACI2_15470 [soil metagenome]
MLVTASMFLPSFLYPWAVAGSLLIIGIFALYMKKKSNSQALVFIPSKIFNVVDILSGLHKIEIRKLRPNSSKPGDS